MQPSASPTTADASLIQAVRDGLARSDQKRLPPQLFYDDVGAALFEVITLLPEYGLTRADRRVLEANSAAIVARVTGKLAVIELGSGSGLKTAHLLRAIGARQASLDYFAVDVSRAALDRCRMELASTATVHPVHADFLDGLRHATASAHPGERLLVLFLGSTIGNFEDRQAIRLLRDVRKCLRPGDAFLLGADLVKPVEQLLPAYDDPAGVTAAFNLNLLARLNRELDADFNLRRFRHFARYDATHKRVEMHLSSREPQNVQIPKAGCGIHFETGETIWTESSHKYDGAALERMAAASGFEIVETWTDHEWPFAESLWEAV